MTAPERRRPLPALAFIGVLCLLTGIVWFRVIHRSDPPTTTAAQCNTTTGKTVGKKTRSRPAKVSVVPHPKRVSVLVLNSTSKDGIATTTRKALTKQGFRVTDAKNDGTAYGGHGLIKGVGEIRYGPRGLPAATLVHFYVPKAAMHETDASSKLVTLSLGAAYKQIEPARAVHKQMRAAHVHYGTPKHVPTKTASC